MASFKSVVLLVGVLGLNATAAQGTGAERDTAIDAAYGFLYRQMDRLHGSVLVTGESEYQDYFPSGMLGAWQDVSARTEECEEAPAGRDCLRIDYRPPASAQDHWAGLYFQYPQGNWGAFRGHDLSGATRVAFWAKAEPPMVVEFIAGGINRGVPVSKALPLGDSFGPVRAGPVRLDERWRRFSIPLEGEDLRSVAGPLAVVFAIQKGARPGSVYLDEVEIDHSRLNEPRLLQSLLAGTCDLGAAGNAAHVYDQALVLLALLARGSPEDLRRAGLVARALVLAQASDRAFRDGRLRNAYASGRVLDRQTGVARLPGRWDAASGRFLEDEYAAGSDTGNAAWAALALVQAHALLRGSEDRPYLDVARRLAEWIVREQRVEDALGGFRGGFEGIESSRTPTPGQLRSDWRSTEHNIDLVALFGRLTAAVGPDSAEGRMWLAHQDHARRFVEAMVARGGNGAHLWLGVDADGALNKAMIPLDAQTWSVLGMGEPRRYAPALDWALGRCGADDGAHAFDFDCDDGDGTWWEGTAQVAAALRSLGRMKDAAPILAALRRSQIRGGPAGGALPAASVCGLTTGLERHWRGDCTVKPWRYPDSPHVGATAWLLFALLGKNPFDLGAAARR